MSVLSKVATNVQKFGVPYTFCFTLKKIGWIKEIPVSLLLKRQQYYINLPLEAQKKELAEYYKHFLGKELHLSSPQTFTEKIQWLKCFMGEPKYVQFIGDRVPNMHDYYVSFFTPDWEKTDINIVGRPYEKEFEKPARLDDMLSLARDMAKDYPYVRVDFYCINDEIYFSELTFTPDSGIMRFNRPELDAEWGKMVDISV